MSGVTLSSVLRLLALPVLLCGCTSSKPPAEGSTGKTGDSGAEAVDSGADTGTLEVLGTLVLGEVQTCDAPLPGPAYVEAGLEWGVDGETFDPEAPGGHEDGPSMAIGDLNEDGYLDLFIVRMDGGGENHLYLGGASGYTEWLGPTEPGRSPVFIDIEGDGDLDLLVGGIRPHVYRLNPGMEGTMDGDGDGFSDVYEELPSMDPPGIVSASTVHDYALGDFDLDGVLDAVVVRTAVPHGPGVATNDRMLHMYPDGIEIEMDAIPEEVGLRHGFDSLAFDEDGDGDVDVYLVHDHGATVGPSTLLRNEDGALIDATDTCYCELFVSAKGIDITDFDRDGQPDVFITGGPLNTLLSRRDGSWVDVSEATGVREGLNDAAGWGAVFLDLDNDGVRDLLLAQGDRWSPGHGESTLPDGNPARFDVPLRLLRQEDGVFTDVAPELSLDVEGSFRAVLATDLNGDGVEDLLVSQASERTLIFVSQGCTAANWIDVEAPLGSRVSVTSAGGTQTDWARADRGLQSTARVPLHFGLGEDEVVERIEVSLPGGAMLRTVGPISARRWVRLEP